MKKTLLHLLTMGFLLAGLLGCGNQSEYEALKAENEKLRREIEDLKFGADRLLAQAKVFLEKREFYKAKSELQALIDRHPASQEVKEARELLEVAENGWKKQKLAEEKAKAEKEKAEKERLANATKKMRVKIDDMNGVTWYYDKTSPQYTNVNGFYAYIGTNKESKPWLRLVIQYAADDWLFIEKYIIKADGQTFEITQNSYGEIKTDNGYGGIWEWLDRKIEYPEYQIIKSVAYGNNTKIRFNGKDYYKDKPITEQQKAALRNVLDAYEALGGTADF
jgi:hypothetical protein